MSKSSMTIDTQDLALRNIHQLINECHKVLLTNLSCLLTLAVHGHACMKAKRWDQAVKDFSGILQCRPGDVHRRFISGMALFKCGKVDDAHRDFSRVLELNSNHVMARYARASCYNSEGEYNTAIQEYMLALQYDGKENARSLRADKRRVGLHENAEHLIRKTLSSSTRSRRGSSSCESIIAVLERASTRTLTDKQKGLEVRQRTEAAPEKWRKNVVQVQVNLTEWTVATIQPLSQRSIEFPPVPLKADVPALTDTETPENLTCTRAPREIAARVVPKTVRKVTVTL